MLKVENVSKYYGDFKAVDNLSFEVKEGEIFGLLGANGAGKTTTFRMIMNLLEPTSGKITLNGKKIDYNVTDEIGFLTEERSLLLKLTVKELMIYYGTLKSMKKDEIISELKKWLKRFKIEEYENKFLETINDDLNIPAAIGIIWDIVRSDKKSKQYAKLLEKFDEVLGLDIKNSEKYLEEQKNIELPEEIEKLVEERKQARLEKNWALSDEIRNKLIENGYQVEDSKDGMTVKKM